MLYKKYHRDYIRQFKKGTKLTGFKMEVDKIEVFYSTTKICIGIFVKRDGYENLRDGFVLIFPNGKINYSIKRKEDAIQKVS